MRITEWNTTTVILQSTQYYSLDNYTSEKIPGIGHVWRRHYTRYF